MNAFLHLIAKGIIVSSLGIATLFGYQSATPSFGAATSNAAVAAVFETSLAAPIGASDTTLSLASISIDSAGDTLVNGQVYAVTIDQGQPNQEFVQGTLSGTSLINLTRGISPLTGTSTVAALAQSHRRGADVKITDWPTLGILNNQMNGIETIPNLLNYSTNVLIQAGSPSSTVATKYYVDQTAVAGAPNANATTKGIVQLATAINAASTTGTGSTGALLVLPSSISTSSDDVAGLHVVVTQNSGKINWNQIDLGTAATFTAQATFTAGTLTTASSTITATSTATANTIGYNIQLNLTASTTITGFTLPQPVFVATSTGAVILSSANTYGASNFTGFAITNAVNGGTVVVQTAGVVKGFSGLTPGADYYVQNSAGTIGTSIPVPEIYVGTAVSATQILIQQRSMQYIGTGSVSGSPSTSTVPAFTRYVVVSGTVSSQNGFTGGVTGTLGMNGGASNPSVTGGAFTCCALGGLTYTVTWNTSGTYAGTVVSSKSVAGGDTGSGSATLWYYR